MDTKRATPYWMALIVVTLLLLSLAAPAFGASHSARNEAQFHNEIALRESIHFRSDEAYVRGVHASADAVKVEQVQGIFTPVEARELLERIDLEHDQVTLYQYFNELSERQSIFGGLYIDHVAGGQLVLQLTHDSPPEQQVRLKLPALRYPQRLRVDKVEWTNQRLEAQFNIISDAMQSVSNLRSVSIDQVMNRVVVVVDPSSEIPTGDGPLNKDELPADLRALVSDPVVTVVSGVVTSTPTAIMAGYGWNKTGGSSNLCTLAFEVTHAGNPAMLTAGHCIPTMATGDNAYYFSTQIGTYSGSSTDGCATNSGNCIDVGILRMNAGSTATDDIFRGGGQSTLDVTGALGVGDYSPGNVRCYYGNTSGLLCGAIVSGNTSFKASHNNRYYRDMFTTDPAPLGGDSGAPVYRTDNATSASAAGILGGTISFGGGSGNDAYHSKWHNAQSFFSLTLTTTD